MMHKSQYINNHPYYHYNGLDNDKTPAAHALRNGIGKPLSKSPAVQYDLYATIWNLPYDLITVIHH